MLFAPCDPESHPHRIGAGLIARGVRPEQILPLGGEVEILADLPLRTERSTRSLLHRRRLDLAGDDRRPGDLLRRLEGALEEDRRHREDIADVVKPVADVIAGKVGGHPDIDAEQVADGVVVFRPVEAAERHPAGPLPQRAIGGEGRVADPGDERLSLLLGRHGAALRGHHPPLDLPQDFEPQPAVDRLGEVGVPIVEMDPSLRRVTGVAFVAEPSQKGGNGVVVDASRPGSLEPAGLQHQRGRRPQHASQPIHEGGQRGSTAHEWRRHLSAPSAGTRCILATPRPRRPGAPTAGHPRPA